MKWIEITSPMVHNKTGGVPQPPSVSIMGSTFTLNNLAIIELSKIWGGADFALSIMVSECGEHIAFGVKASTMQKTGIAKSISSAEARSRLMIDSNVFGRLKIQLRVEDNILVGDVSQAQ